MTDDLREKIARRLCDRTVANPSYRAWQFLSERSRNRWRRAADECIRLMEWARRECDYYLLPVRDGESESRRAFDPPSLPPDDWQP